MIGGLGLGLGRALCTAFANENSIVCGFSRSTEHWRYCEEHVQNLNAKASGIFSSGDATSQQEVTEFNDRVLRKFGSIDVGICNVGPTVAGNWSDLCLQDWKDSFVANMAPFINLCNVWLPQMKGCKKGSIVNIGSVSSTQPGRRTFPRQIMAHLS